MKKTLTEPVYLECVASRQYKALLESFRLFNIEMESKIAEIYSNAYNNKKD